MNALLTVTYAVYLDVEKHIYRANIHSGLGWFFFFWSNIKCFQDRIEFFGYISGNHLNHGVQGNDWSKMK